MDRKIIIAKVLIKLSKTPIDPSILEILVADLKRIYQRYSNKDFKDTLPKEILKYVGNSMDKYDFNQKDKLKFLMEAKKNKFFDFTINKNLEKAWRLILKKWNLSNYRLEGGL
jgi:hypothetical protein